MVSTADLISGLVARRSTRNVNNWCDSCDSSFAASAFSVITGDLMMSQTVLIATPPPHRSCIQWPLAQEPAAAQVSLRLYQATARAPSRLREKARDSRD